MRKQRPLALVGGGTASRYAVVRLPAIASQIGPVKASSFRLASRIANSIRCGYPVRHYSDLKDSPMILLCLPDRAVEKVVSELAASPFDVQGKTVVLCSGELDSRALQTLRDCGAEAASLCPLESIEPEQFLVEGDRAAIRQLRQLLDQRRLLEISTDGKSLCLAGFSFATSLTTPLIDAALCCLQGAGLKKNQALLIIERLLNSTFRAYLKGGRKSWTGPLAARDREAIERRMRAVFESDLVLGRFFRESARLTCEHFRRDSEWLSNLL